MKTVYWRLRQGSEQGQESRDQKMRLGLEYIEKLKSDGEVVDSVTEERDRLVIKLREPEDQ